MLLDYEMLLRDELGDFCIIAIHLYATETITRVKPK